MAASCGMLSLDDGYLPPKTVELTRRLIEEDKVAFLFNYARHADQQRHAEIRQQQEGARSFSSPRAPPSSATGSTTPGAMGWQPTYQVEGHIYAKYILQQAPDAKVSGAVPG